MEERAAAVQPRAGDLAPARQRRAAQGAAPRRAASCLRAPAAGSMAVSGLRLFRPQAHRRSSANGIGDPSPRPFINEQRAPAQRPASAPQVLQGARLPESEEEWRALEAALAGCAPGLRPDSSVPRLFSELRGFVQLLQLWWANRKRGEGPSAGTLLTTKGPL